MDIIIVDENIVLRKQLRQMVEFLGHRVIAEAENGLHGYNKYCEFKVDLLIINLRMPIFDGFRTIERVIQYDKNAKIVVMSEKEKNKSIFKALDMGAIHYIELPLEKEKIVKTLEDVSRMMTEME